MAVAPPPRHSKRNPVWQFPDDRAFAPWRSPVPTRPRRVPRTKKHVDSRVLVPQGVIRDAVTFPPTFPAAPITSSAGVLTSALYTWPDLSGDGIALPTALNETFTDVFGDTGAGSIQFLRNDPILANFDTSGNKIVVMSVRGTRAFAMVVEAERFVIIGEGEEAQQGVEYSGRGHLSKLEKEVVHAPVYITSPISDDRYYNWTSLDGFDDSAWGDAAFVHTVRQKCAEAAFILSLNGIPTDAEDVEQNVTSSGIPDLDLGLFWAPGIDPFASPEADLYVRAVLHPEVDGIYYFVGYVDDSAEWYIDGQRIGETTGYNWMGVLSTQVTLAAGFHILSARVHNAQLTGLNSANYGWALYDSEPAFLNPNSTVRGNLINTASSFDRILYDPAEVPGMSVGQVIRLARAEAVTRGSPAMTLHFSDTADSNGNPWTVLPDVATKTGTDHLTFFAKELGAVYCDLYMAPSGLDLYAWRIDERGSVRAVEYAEGVNLRRYEHTGEYMPVTYLYLRHRGGWATLSDPTLEALYGHIEATIDFGAQASLDEVYRLGEAVFGAHGMPLTEITAEFIPMSDDEWLYSGLVNVADQVTVPDGVERIKQAVVAKDSALGYVKFTLTLRNIVADILDRHSTTLKKV